MNFSSLLFCVSPFKLIYVQLFQIWQVSWSSTLSPSLSSPSSSSSQFSKTTETSSAAANFSASQNALSPVHHEDCNFPVAEESLHKFMALFNFPTQAKRGGLWNVAGKWSKFGKLQSESFKKHRKPNYYNKPQNNAIIFALAAFQARKPNLALSQI